MVDSLEQAFWLVFVSVASASGVLYIIGYFVQQALYVLRAAE